MKKILITVLSSLAVVSCASTSDSEQTGSSSDTNYSQLSQNCTDGSGEYVVSTK